MTGDWCITSIGLAQGLLDDILNYPEQISALDNTSHLRILVRRKTCPASPLAKRITWLEFRIICPCPKAVLLQGVTLWLCLIL